MFIGIGKSLPQVADLPGPSRPGNPSGSDERLITVWRTTSPDEIITLWGGNTTVAPTAKLNDIYNYEVDWGDGSTETVVGVRNKTHTYTTAGDYEVKITGQFGGFQFLNGPQADRDKLIELKNWGISKLWGLYYTFFNCTELDVTATDAPYFDGIGNLEKRTNDCHSAFRGNKTVNLDISKFDLSWSSRFYNLCYGNNDAETIKMPNNLTATTYDHSYMFYNVGTNTTNGCTLSWDNYTNEYTGTYLSANSMFAASKWKKLDLNNWSIKAITGSYTFGSFVDVPGNELNMKNWTTNNGGAGWLSFSSTFRGNTASIVDTTGWDVSVSENCTSWSHMAYSSPLWLEWKGLSYISLKSVTTTINAFYNCNKLKFKSGGSNFSNTSSPDGSLVSTRQMFGLVGSALSIAELADAEVPNVSNWNMSNCTTINSMFYGADVGDEMPNVDNWDLSSLTEATSFAYASGKASYTKPWYIDWRNANISNALTNMTNFNRAGPIQSIDLRGADLSGVTSMSHSYYAPLVTDGGDINDLRFIIDSSTSFAGLTSGTNWLINGKWRTTNWDSIIQRVKATNTNTGWYLTGGNSNFTGDLVWPSNLVVYMTDSSVTTEITDTNADFVTSGVTVGDIVFTKSGSNYKWAEVVSVDSATKLTINAAIVSAAYAGYNVCKSQVAKDKYHLIANNSLVVVDGGPLIS